MNDDSRADQACTFLVYETFFEKESTKKILPSVVPKTHRSEEGETKKWS